MLSNPPIRSIGSEPGDKDHSSPAPRPLRFTAGLAEGCARVPDGDRPPGELAHLLKVRRTVLAPLRCGVLRQVP